MNITLTKELEKFVTTKVRSGGYADASEVVRKTILPRLIRRNLRNCCCPPCAARIGP